MHRRRRSSTSRAPRSTHNDKQGKERSMVPLITRQTLLAACAALGASIAAPALAQDFFAGKSIDLLIGAPPGGGYDIYGRVVARHIGRHIPGNPNIVPKNMPGAGSARAAGFLSMQAPKDGTVIANIMPGAVIGPLLDPKTREAVRPDRGAVHRQRQQRHPRLRVGQPVEDQDLRGCAHAEGGVRRRVVEQLHPRLRLHAQEDVGRELEHGHRLQGHGRPHARASSAARSTASAASTGRA